MTMTTTISDFPVLDAPPTAPPTASPAAPRTRPLDEAPALAAMAVELIRTPTAMVQLSVDEARQVVAFMRMVVVPKDTVLFREGDAGSVNTMLLLLEGQVVVDTGQPGDPQSVEIAVIGPGSIIGEMSLLDGAPRSARCTAVSTVKAAGLSRGGLERLIEEHPRVAAKLMVGVAQRIADRLRSLGQHLLFYSQIAASLQAQLAERRNEE